jgi:hypothetical protein
METADILTTHDSSHVEITNEDSTHQFLRYHGYYSLHEAEQLTKLIMLKQWGGYAKMCVEKRPEPWPNDRILHHDNAPAHKALSSSFWPKNRLLKWNTHHIPLNQMLSRSFQNIRSIPWSRVTFRNKPVFLYCELSPHPTPKLEEHLLSAIRDCLFTIFAATLHKWRSSHPSATRGRAKPWCRKLHCSQTGPTSCGHVNEHEMMLSQQMKGTICISNAAKTHG